MKKVYVNIRSGEATKERFEAISPEYEFVYKEDLDAEVVIGHVPPSRLKEFKNLKWVQAPAVGIDKYIKKGVLADGVILTNAADVHSIEVAEHVLAAVLMMVKKIHLYHNDQKKHFWTDEGMVKQISRLKVCIVGTDLPTQGLHRRFGQYRQASGQTAQGSGRLRDRRQAHDDRQTGIR